MKIISGVMQKALKVVIYGPEGIGKSTFAAQAPNPLFIDTEGSTTRMDVRRLPAPASFAQITEEVRYVLDHPEVCGTLVVDTFDWAQRLCVDAVCSKNQKGGIEDFGYGKGYSYVFEDCGRLLDLLDQVVDRGIHVIVTAHAAVRKFEQPDESGAYDRWELKLISSQKCSIANLLKEWADMVLFANYETFVVKNEDKKNKATGGKRVMYTAHHPCWDAKNRFGLPEKLPFAFDQIGHLFHTAYAPRAEANPATAGRSLSQSTQPTCPSEPPAGIPLALWELMQPCGVTEAQIRQVVAKKGYYPESTPIQNYDPAFVSGVLVGAWTQVHEMIEKENN